MAADPFLFPMYYLLFKTVSDKWGHLHPMRTEISYRFIFFLFFFFLNFYGGHRDFFTKHYFYTITESVAKTHESLTFSEFTSPQFPRPRAHARVF